MTTKPRRSDILAHIDSLQLSAHQALQKRRKIVVCLGEVPKDSEMAFDLESQIGELDKLLQDIDSDLEKFGGQL